jgi:hypothetical protein
LLIVSGYKKEKNKVKFCQKLKLAIAGVTLGFSAMQANPIQAATFSFFFPDGDVAGAGSGNVSGSFTALDNDFSGLITLDEVTEFQAIFTGTNFGANVVFSIPAFTHNLSNLVSFSFDLSDFANFNFRSTSTLDGNTILQTTSDAGNDFISGRGVAVGIKDKGGVGTSGLFTVEQLPEPVSSVAEPSTVVALSFLGLAGLMKRKRMHMERND